MSAYKEEKSQSPVEWGETWGSVVYPVGNAAHVLKRQLKEYGAVVRAHSIGQNIGMLNTIR